MRNLLKIKNGKNIIFLLLIFNQFLFNSYALSQKKIYKFDSSKDNLKNKTYRDNKILLTESPNLNNESLTEYAEDIEKYIENIYELNNLDNFKEKTKQLTPINTNLEKSDKDFINNDIENKKSPSDKEDYSGELKNKKEIIKKSDEDSINKNTENKNLPTDKEGYSGELKIKKEIIKKSDKESINKNNENQNLPSDKEDYSGELKIKKEIIKRIDLKKTNLNKLPLPSKSEIFSSEFEVKARGYVNLKGPKITLNLKSVDSIEALKLVGNLGNYGIVIVEDNNPGSKASSNNSKITVDFKNKDISDVFNSILLTSNLQAIVEKNIIFIGQNILNKSIQPKVSKTYRLNQVNAASVADYLSTLGAKVSKVRLVSGSISGSEIGDGYVNKKEFKDKTIPSYGIEGGPLYGLIGTADLRLQTITLIGSKDLITTAEKYIESLDIRHRQVALTIKIIDVSLTKTDLKQNLFEFKSGETEVIGNSGISIATGNFSFGSSRNSNINNVVTGGLASGQFFNWLEAKITSDNAKVLASPTLILGENPNLLSSGAASVDDSLKAATIGRPFKNEGFIKVGETVITGFQQSSDEGVVTCTAQEGTAGITFGAKVDKIDDNGFVTFALSPAISSVTRTVEIAGCGIQNTLSVRKLDTGSIRVKNGDTLILTGVIKEEDNLSTSKIPILGDIPIFGNLFKSNSTQKRKSDLIILVTPRILKDDK